MTSDDTPDTSFTMTIAGREIRFNRPKSGQLIMLRTLLERLKDQISAAETDEQRGGHLVNFNRHRLNLISSLVVASSDLAFLEDQLVAGNIDVEDLYPALSGGKKPEPEPGDDEAPAKALPIKPAKKATKATKATKPTRKTPHVASVGRKKL